MKLIPLQKRPRRTPLLLPPHGSTTGGLYPEREPSPKHTGTLILGFQLPERSEVSVVSMPPVWYFVTAV